MSLLLSRLNQLYSLSGNFVSPFPTLVLSSAALLQFSMSALKIMIPRMTLSTPIAELRPSAPLLPLYAIGSEDLLAPLAAVSYGFILYLLSMESMSQPHQLLLSYIFLLHFQNWTCSSKLNPLKFERKVFFLVFLFLIVGNNFLFYCNLNLQKNFKNSSKDYHIIIYLVHQLLIFYPIYFIIL